MDFDEFPSIFIRHNSITHEFFTSHNDIGEFVKSLRHKFGAEAIPDGKEIFLVTESSPGPDGQQRPPRSAPLTLFLEHKAKSERIFTLEFSNAQAPVQLSHPMGHQVPGTTVMQVDTARAAKVKKGRKQTEKRSEHGEALSTLGQNVEDCLTHNERVEMEKYILYHWSLDQDTGVPLLQREQPDSSKVDLSIYEMAKNPVLRGRPERVLKRQAEK